MVEICAGGRARERTNRCLPKRDTYHARDAPHNHANDVISSVAEGGPGPVQHRWLDMKTTTAGTYDAHLKNTAPEAFIATPAGDRRTAEVAGPLCNAELLHDAAAQPASGDIMPS